MKIGIDCRLAGIENAGIGRYIEELVRGLVADRKTNWVLFFQKPNQLPWLVQSDHIKIVIAPIRHYSLQEQIEMPGIFMREHLDLLHVPHFNVPLFYRCPYIVTIHDLLWHDQRGSSMTTLSPLVYRAKYAAYKLVSSLAVKRALRVFVPAETIKQTVISHVPGCNPEKIIVTYEGVGQNWKNIDTSKSFSDKRLDPKSKALFYTGSLYPHKNVMLVVRALRELPNYHLFISSARNVFVDAFMKEVADLGLEHQVTHLGCLTDRELLGWYQHSFALVQPSFSEGFGLTGVEAMAAGVPILASDIPIFREIYRNCFQAFDPAYIASFISAVHALETRPRLSLIKQGQRLAGEYQWSKMVDLTLDAYRSINA